MYALRYNNEADLFCNDIKVPENQVTLLTYLFLDKNITFTTNIQSEYLNDFFHLTSYLRFTIIKINISLTLTPKH